MARRSQTARNQHASGGQCRRAHGHTYDYRCFGGFGSVVGVCGVFLWGVGVFGGKFFLFLGLCFFGTVLVGG